MKKTTKKRIKIFSALEVANMCGVVNQTAINWIRNGYLPAFNTPGGQYRVYRDDLIKFILGRGMRLPDELASDDDVPVADWKTVMIVDDDRVLNKGLRSFFDKQKAGLNVLQSFDGFDAGTQLIKSKPGFVILDLGLPGVNGKEICRKLKSDETFGCPYVIVITGLDDEGLEEEVMSLGADAFFRKPIEFQDIFEEIAAVLKD